MMLNYHIFFLFRKQKSENKKIFILFCKMCTLKIKRENVNTFMFLLTDLGRAVVMVIIPLSLPQISTVGTPIDYTQTIKLVRTLIY